MENVTGREKMAFVEDCAPAESELRTFTWKQTDVGLLQEPGSGRVEGVGCWVEGAEHCWIHMNLTPQPQLADMKTGNK